MEILQNYQTENPEEYIDYKPQEIEDYANGFNHATFLAEYAPEFLAEIDISTKGVNEFYKEGIEAGKEYYAREQAKAQELQELQNIRNKSRDRNLELEL